MTSRDLRFWILEFGLSATRPLCVGLGRRIVSVAESSRFRDFSNATASGELSHFPSCVIPMGTTSYLSLSSAVITEAAETSETSCSAERPPKRTPTRILDLGFWVLDLCFISIQSSASQARVFPRRWEFEESSP